MLVLEIYHRTVSVHLNTSERCLHLDFVPFCSHPLVLCSHFYETPPNIIFPLSLSSLYLATHERVQISHVARGRSSDRRCCVLAPTVHSALHASINALPQPRSLLPLSLPLPLPSPTLISSCSVQNQELNEQQQRCPAKFPPCLISSKSRPPEASPPRPPAVLLTLPSPKSPRWPAVPIHGRHCCPTPNVDSSTSTPISSAPSNRQNRSLSG